MTDEMTKEHPAGVSQKPKSWDDFCHFKHVKIAPYFDRQICPQNAY